MFWVSKTDKSRNSAKNKSGSKLPQLNRIIYRVKYSTDYGKVKGFFRCVDNNPYFYKYRNMESGTSKKRAERVAKYADMFSAVPIVPTGFSCALVPQKRRGVRRACRGGCDGRHRPRLLCEREAPQDQSDLLR